MTTIEQRIEQLERRVKRYRWGMVVLAVGLCAVVSIAATSTRGTTHEVLRTRRLEVVNAAGANVAVLVVDDEHGGMLSIYNNAGQMVGGVYAFEHGGWLSTYNNAGQAMGAMGTVERSVTLCIYNNASELLWSAP